MRVVATPSFVEQLKALLLTIAESNPEEAKRFKLYLDTILLNLPSKAQKYKPSIYFDDADVKDIEHQGCTIPFYYDHAGAALVLLGIIDNRV
ncbi:MULTISPECIES: type II toxin-antitoxin system RelE/ParE family toxin [Sulfurimonas]|uniref:Type II toxin-antitoxin system RelE/ParE family toxin n=1 Tax=Sulfurimonas diazotrophicus TaxID=3131939 RepID=A0ABZ3H9F7_9BACT